MLWWVCILIYQNVFPGLKVSLEAALFIHMSATKECPRSGIISKGVNKTKRTPWKRCNYPAITSILPIKVIKESGAFGLGRQNMWVRWPSHGLYTKYSTPSLVLGVTNIHFLSLGSWFPWLYCSYLWVT